MQSKLPTANTSITLKYILAGYCLRIMTSYPTFKINEVCCGKILTGHIYLTGFLTILRFGKILYDFRFRFYG